MNTEAPKTQTNASKMFFDGLATADFMWAPYRTVSRALLITQQNVAGYMDVNRSLALELQAILRRSRDLAIKLSEKTMERSSSPSKAMMSAAEIDEMYDFALSGMREVGDATLAVQLRSIEALREHALTMLKAAAEAAQTPAKV